MKLLKKSIIRLLTGVALTAAPAVTVTSCQGLVYDDLDPCDMGLRLRFIYDYNLEFANAFPTQVDCLTLFVYDGEGKYVTTVTETSDILADENYRMTIDLPAGDYQLVAYGGMACPEASFHYIETPVDGSYLNQLSVEMNADCIDANPGKNLHKLFYGKLNTHVSSKTGEYTEETVPMMRDTNNIRIVLQNTSGAEIKADDFIFTITDNNVLMNYDNSVIKVANPCVYSPFVKGDDTVGSVENGDTPFYAAFAEFSVARLVETNSPRLTITRRVDGNVVFSIPILNYLSILRSDQYSSMDFQEYLDRENTWNMIFLLDAQGNWLKTQIVVNDWVVRINDFES